MTIEVGCQCGKRFKAQPHLAGKRVGCPSCGSPITIPLERRPKTPASAIEVTCQCGQRFGAKPHLAGKRVRCPVCQRPLQVPEASDASFASQVSPMRPSSADDHFWDELSKPIRTSSPQTETKSPAAETVLANQLLAKARVQQVERDDATGLGGAGQVFYGIVIMVGAAVWFGAGLLAGIIFFYPPIMFVAGALTMINGFVQAARR
jgi:RNase P subunit RPR2